MTCREVLDFLSDYVDGDLSESVHQTFEGHMGRCPNCQTLLDQIRTTIVLARQTGQEPDLPPLPEDLVAAIMKTLE